MTGKQTLFVIILAYNCQKFILHSVQSVLNQKMQAVRLILVGDGSTDRTALLCDELAEQDDRICVLHKENGGVSSARNTGIEYALAHMRYNDYIAFLDADDAWAGGFLMIG